ncbi:4Fe-4S single cluster domain-containing protein [Catenulispora rubra]|uniref:4Fe-4S single cluster domain-containing protein n=1 Tax=Catenulispora rubra TaxID=280293 RepID=UPI0018923EE9|nr:4Fe-4S single cluster domain-containing protein [Catenulispora rubra]
MTLQLSRTAPGLVEVLGPGRRFVLWVQGCPLACPGCMSRDTWDADGGREVTLEELTALWRDFLDLGATGITVSGGEPMEQAAALADFLDSARDEATAVGREADVLVYTGYEEDELASLGPAARRLADSADALITGRFRVAEPTRLAWRGSANQRLLPRTPLGRRRYAGNADRLVENTEMQVFADDQALLLVGIPDRGVLTQAERRMRGDGLTFGGGVSWRP